jgi:hypothetical protein
VKGSRIFRHDSPLGLVEPSPLPEFSDGVRFGLNLTEPSTSTPDTTTAVATLPLLSVHEFVCQQIDQALNERTKVISSSPELSKLVCSQDSRILDRFIHPDRDSSLPTSTSVGTFSGSNRYPKPLDPSRTSESNSVPNHIIRDVCFISHPHLTSFQLLAASASSFCFAAKASLTFAIRSLRCISTRRNAARADAVFHHLDRQISFLNMPNDTKSTFSLLRKTPVLRGGLTSLPS